MKFELLQLSDLLDNCEIGSIVIKRMKEYDVEYMLNIQCLQKELNLSIANMQRDKHKAIIQQ